MNIPNAEDEFPNLEAALVDDADSGSEVQPLNGEGVPPGGPVTSDVRAGT